MDVYRIEQTKYGAQLTGEGAFLVGGRWNHKGTRVLYTSTSRALCILETLVHTSGLPLLNSFSILTISVPDNFVRVLDDLPVDWDADVITNSTRDCGSEFVKNKKSIGLMMPSVIVPQEFNMVINVLHPEMSKVKLKAVEDFNYDTRLI